MVMPRSRSRSFESITRLATTWLAAEDAALAEHGVHQRGLAVVHVGDNGDIANVSVHGVLKNKMGAASATLQPLEISYETGDRVQQMHFVL